MYISDEGLHKIRLADLGNNNINTLTSNSYSPTFITLDSVNSRVLFTDPEDYSVRYFSLSSPSTVTPVSASTNTVSGITVSTAGEYYFADGSSKVIKLTLPNTKSNYVTGLSNPQGLFWRSNELFIVDADSTTPKIKKYDGTTLTDIAGGGSSGCANDIEATSCKLSSSISGIYVTNKNEIYITEARSSPNGNIKKIYPYCDSGYQLSSDGKTCDPICYSKVGDAACGGPTQGTCSAPDTCQCTTNYFGNECGSPKCYGKTSNACNNQGTCTAVDTCMILSINHIESVY
ncbi:predicted protein [Naegleria gruberi]|uniref:Predicted protein n=1 Tax=Naegleria gruberi TaxID=5762 RepID=D2W5S1_NAEGR|nr:uncharacterized protein NAEGRDRAFT_76764 [Naegleria gruberi]EFC35581.1 predicted protein [Naegleria gruberi]|eukprot:XP_002668325.1 predicted protein [Naegleria gruberi strain NEG-M]